jgi:agmatinase
MKTTHDFLGDEAAAEDESIHVLAAAVEESTSYMTGTARAPAAIIEASRQIELYDCRSDTDLEGAGIATVDTGTRTLDGLAGFVRKEREAIAGGFHCFIGGEHSITPVILEEMKYGDIGIVWLDAHSDLREEYLGNSRSHACAARNSLRFGHIVEIGVRSMSRSEAESIETDERIEVFENWGKEAARAIDGLPDRIYLSLDFDAVDPSLIRAVGTPEPGGLTWGDLLGVFDHLFGSKTVVGMDAVELCPSESDTASSFTAAKAVYEALIRAVGVKGLR